MEQKHKIVIYTDGSCLNNPGKGGWSFVLMDETLGLVDEYIGCQEMSTNNQMEISAALIALEHILNDRCLSKNEIDEILINNLKTKPPSGVRSNIEPSEWSTY